MDNDDLRKQLETRLQELMATGEEIKRRLGTATEGAKAQAKETWHKLEPQIERAQQQLESVTGEAVAQLEGLFGKLETSLRSVRDKL
jgi:ElaB/YqjD/DUF883 family membrane-anchored ribosome-binding protein